jgi:hypothetical protein
VRRTWSEAVYSSPTSGTLALSIELVALSVLMGRRVGELGLISSIEGRTERTDLTAIVAREETVKAFAVIWLFGCRQRTDVSV